jgi:hypothetical protein
MKLKGNYQGGSFGKLLWELPNCLDLSNNLDPNRLVIVIIDNL